MNLSRFPVKSRAWALMVPKRVKTVMLRYRILGSLCVLTASCLALADADSSSTPLGSSAFYSQKQPSRDGIGRLYMGREISFVMGHRGVDWLERRGREREERTDLVVAGMQLEPDAVVADLGAGSGHFAFRVSPRVPQGRVLAVDIQPEMLAAIEKRKRLGPFLNVETVLGTETDPNLPAGSVDAVLMVDAYHEFSHPREMMVSTVEALRPGGQVFLVEYRSEDPTVPILPLHKMTESQARLEMEAVGLEFVENRAMLPQQHFLIFRKPKPSS
ncbi:MAG: class I SAM-dependent methyltransferase [Thermoanaerobaculia bacterium]